MSKLADYLKTIAKTEYLDAKIKAAKANSDKPSVPASRGTAIQSVATECALHYATDANSFDFASILSGAEGPTIADPCSRINTITGLTDLDTSQASASLGAIVHLIIQMDGVFK